MLTPFYVKNVLHEGPGVLGALWAGSGVGAVLGAIALIVWNDHHRVARLWAAAIIAPAGLFVTAITREPAVAIVAQAFVSFAFSSQLGLIQTMIQESTPQQFRGRVMSLHGITFNGTMPFAALAASGLAVAAGLPFVIVLGGALFLVANVVGADVRRRRHRQRRRRRPAASTTSSPPTPRPPTATASARTPPETQSASPTPASSSQSQNVVAGRRKDCGTAVPGCESGAAGRRTSSPP